jgi:hypothetical protein
VYSPRGDGTKIVLSRVMRVLALVFFFACLPLRAEQTTIVSGFSIGPDGLAVGGLNAGRDIAISSGGGQISARGSVSGTVSRLVEPPRPTVVRIAPAPSSLTDSDSFFRGVGGPAASPEPRRPASYGATAP